MNMLRVKNIYSGYLKGINILQGISITAELGKITIIIGGNGVGKSTLLKTIYGYLSPIHGKKYYKDEDITHEKPFVMPTKGISYITQRHSIFSYLTVEENLELGGWTFRKDKDLMQQRMLKNYERFPFLAEKRKAEARSLSGGQQRALEIARGLMTEPEMILLDEPTAGLEPRRRKKIYSTLEELKNNEGRGILLVDQNVRQAMEIADYIYVVEMGKNHIEGTRRDFDTDLKEMIKDWF
jgi:branched-chain amino acid transport system ATP-binding protein